MNRTNRRQVLDCGDGVGEVTALACVSAHPGIESGDYAAAPSPQSKTLARRRSPPASHGPDAWSKDQRTP